MVRKKIILAFINKKYLVVSLKSVTFGVGIPGRSILKKTEAWWA